MDDILRQLFYGDYVPFEILTELNGSKKSDRGDVTTQLKALVQPEQFGLIEKLLGDVYQSQTEDMIKAFKVGVRFGVQFLVQTCLTDGSTGQEATE